MSESQSMGAPYAYGNAKAFTFDDQGLPWVRVNHQLWRINNDLTMEQMNSGTIYPERMNHGANPSLMRFYVFAGLNNLVLKSQGAFFLGSYVSTANPGTLSAEMKLFDFGVPTTVLFKFKWEALLQRH